MDHLLTASLEEAAEEASDCSFAKTLGGYEFLEGSLDCVFLVDHAWRFRFLNRRAREEIAGGKDLIGKVLWEEFPEARGTKFEESYLCAMDERVHANFETYFAPLSAWYEVQAVPLTGGGIGVWFRNINERRIAEDELRAAEERYRLVASAATDLVMEWDIESSEVRWTAALWSELGYEKHVVSPGWCASRIHPDDRDRLKDAIDRCIAEGGRLECEARFLKANGEYVDFHHRAIFQRSREGRVTRMICALQDVTERNRASEELRRREAQLNNIFGQALVGIMECTPDGRPTLVNSRFCEILGRSMEELRTCSVADYTHPEDLERNLAILNASAKQGAPFQIEKRYIRPDGSEVWCLVNVSFVRGPSGQLESSIIVAEDISEKKKAEAELRASELLYRSVLEASTDCIKILDLDGRLELMNEPGLSAMELPGLHAVRGQLWADLWPAEARPTVEEALAKARTGKGSRFSAFCPTAKGAPRWWDVAVSPMLNEGGAVTSILSISRDITVQRAAAAEVKWASEHDPITGLANRRAFEAHLQAAILRAMQRDTKVGLLLLDLDHFKHVNDTLGHAAGDHLLAVFGKRLQQSLRAGDFVARLGGDEFAVIVEAGDVELDLLGAGESILARLQEPILHEGRTMSAGASIGGAVFPQDAASANQLFNNADTALYALKESGRGGTRMFHQHMREEAQLVSSQLSLARTALTAQTVDPHYQQKVSLRTGSIVGFEALLRWKHVNRGLQTPETVAEAFKDYELATKIGELMQVRVFSDVRRWLDQGFPIGFVAINAAPVEFLRDDFAERLLARMEKHQIPPSLVEIEITEHVFFERGSEFVGRALNQLSAAGVRIALDDFGTGYSSLSHLRDYPVDVVKIDRSFIERVTTDQEVRAIVSAVIELAKSLNIEVVAEGVELEDQKDMLINYGCDMGQGYLFGRAVDAEKVTSLLQASATRPLRAA